MTRDVKEEATFELNVQDNNFIRAQMPSIACILPSPAPSRPTCHSVPRTAEISRSGPEDARLFRTAELSDSICHVARGNAGANRRDSLLSAVINFSPFVLQPGNASMRGTWHATCQSKRACAGPICDASPVSIFLFSLSARLPTSTRGFTSAAGSFYLLPAQVRLTPSYLSISPFALKTSDACLLLVSGRFPAASGREIEGR